jgi:4-diphosphocytidyl-2-C-methyl-D-erythritol kinase
MLVFPNCKINLGLHVLKKRPDGYHAIETIFYPVNWCDALEVIENKLSAELFTFTCSGLKIEGTQESNLIFKAWKIITSQKKIPPIQVHLHKNIPMGAGLGGGSSDAAYFINALNEKFSLGFTTTQKLEMASELGSDCAFFIENKPVFAEGKGNEFSTHHINLSGYYILIVYPNIHSNTKQAYEGLTPKEPTTSLNVIVKNNPLIDWKHTLINDFESSIFKKYPTIKLLKEQLYQHGALYASLSGSGSAIFGIFDREPMLNLQPDHSYYLQKPSTKIL